ncbi:hypothetical protein EDB84DRAFT_1437333 [Lactarius hengduanensis]|nr:hypothetical protein EDB84DRAFT_1437333 [Lactarius hengduanensis]
MKPTSFDPHRHAPEGLRPPLQNLRPRRRARASQLTAGRGQRAEWAYGAPLTDSRWRDGYHWRPHERELNALPMFTHTIGVEGFGELSVHYVHQLSATKGAIPLLFVHGFFPDG